jgi:hypothetical protein
MNIISAVSINLTAVLLIAALSPLSAWGMISYHTSKDNTNKIARVQATIISGFVGIAILLISCLIIRLSLSA